VLPVWLSATISVYTQRNTSISTFLIADLVWGSAEFSTKIIGPQTPHVYERKMDASEDLVRRTVDANTSISDRDTLCRLILSVVKRENCVPKLKAGILNICYSSEFPGYLKLCEPLFMISSYNNHICFIHISNFPSHPYLSNHRDL
jgi:hypothetical protein